MQNIDWIIIAVFFAILLAIPMLTARKGASSTKEFFLSGRSMPWWLIGVSVMAASTSTDSANLFTEIIRKDGMSGNWAWWAFLLTGLMTVFVYAKLWHRSGVTTDVEFYELRYSGKPAAFLRALRAVYLGFVFNLLILGSVVMAGVKIGIILFGVSATTVVLVTAVAGVIYAAFGGVRGVIYTDFYLFAVIMIGAVVAAVYALGQPEVGGMAGLVAKLEEKGTLDFFPKFTDMDTLMAVFIMPVAMHWWTVCKSGAEPGGGSYIVQRILTAKNENHAIGGMFFFSLAHHAFRPFPWYIVGLCSILVFPDITKAFPNVPANYQGGDVAYPAMLKLVPPGWYGLVAASMAGALLSTVAALLSIYSTYLVNDIYGRFFRPRASERELIWATRGASVLLMAAACLIAPFLQSAKSAFDLMLLIGAGTGPIFLLRWFWMRINAWSEIAGLVTGLVAAVFLHIVWPHLFGAPLQPWVKILWGTIATTVAWIAVTLITRPEPTSVLERFRSTVRADGRDVGKGLIMMTLAAFACFGAMYATGAWCYGWYLKASIITLLSALAGMSVYVLFHHKAKPAGVSSQDAPDAQQFVQ
jgi:SSS family transporter